ncbi:hypothetical protein [Sphingobium bisphenolivorans]|uniref:hypothetical protein n=1 Tax=Sphingobium bisphenolivorans TaxID=1335760 RepID=UPI00039CED74|nr:hypothetical protein [Sphingobium bisphenolivorans]
MIKAGWLTGTMMAAALVAGSTASAQALQPRLSYPQEQDDITRDDAPDSGYEEDGRTTQRQADDDFSDVVARDRAGTAADRRDERAGSRDELAVGEALDSESEHAVNDCAVAARDEAEREGGYAEVRQVQAPRETRNGYDVEGDVEVRSGWRAQDERARHFTCSVQNGRVAEVYFHRARAAR